MKFSASDKNSADAYAAQARNLWGDTEAYREFEARTAGRSKASLREDGEGLMRILAAFGTLKEKPASDPAVQAQVGTLQAYITDRFYACTDEILAGLGALYAAGGEMTESIDRAGGPGTAAFAAAAIAYRCG